METVVALLMGLGYFFVRAWMVMITIGALHTAVPEVPAISYSASVLLVMLVSVLSANPSTE